jgi:hypothetical protein
VPEPATSSLLVAAIIVMAAVRHARVPIRPL